MRDLAHNAHVRVRAPSLAIYGSVQAFATRAHTSLVTIFSTGTGTSLVTTLSTSTVLILSTYFECTNIHTHKKYKYTHVLAVREKEIACNTHTCMHKNV